MSESNANKPATLRRFERARARRQHWDGLLSEAYRYAIPNHDPRGHQTRGSQRDSDVYDNTAVNAVQWKKARLHGQLFPPFREWMDFTPDSNLYGQAMGDGKDSHWKEFFKDARDKFHAAIEVSNFHIEIDPALGDACVSTGCLMIHAGSPENPLRFEAVPIAQLIPEEGPDGMIRTLFREWRISGRQITEKWPDAKLPEPIRKGIIKEPDDQLPVVEALLHDYATDRCRYEVWLTGGHENSGDTLILTRMYPVSPAIAFRMDKAPGEWMGRGPVLNVLGDIKTANKVVELTLKNASIAVTGIWQADDDGVLNLSNIKLTPGTIIPKAQGSQGLQPLQAPGRFDVSQIILQQLQENIRRGIQGPSLPPTDEGTRTATEIDARMAEHQAVELPISLRLLSELDYPLAERVLSILSSPEMAGSPYYIDTSFITDKGLSLVPTSPLVRLQDLADAAQSQQIYAQAAQLFPDIIGGVVNRPGYLKQALGKAGFPAEHFLSEEQQAEFEALVRVKMAGIEAAQRMAATLPRGGPVGGAPPRGGTSGPVGGAPPRGGTSGPVGGAPPRGEISGPVGGAPPRGEISGPVGGAPPVGDINGGGL